MPIRSAHTPATTATSGAVTRTASLRTARLTTDAPRPRIRTRKRWGADESWRNSPPRYIRTIKQVHVHHTASGNDYGRGDEFVGIVHSILRSTAPGVAVLGMMVSATAVSSPMRRASRNGLAAAPYAMS